MTTTLPSQLERLVRIRAAEDSAKSRANRWRYYSEFKTWLIFQIGEDAEFAEACEVYRGLCELEST